MCPAEKTHAEPSMSFDMGEVVDDILASIHKNLDKKNSETNVIDKPYIRKEKKYKCNKCSKSFAQFASAKKHCTKTPKVRKCNICNFQPVQGKNLKRHMRKHEKDSLKQTSATKSPDECKDCGITFSRKHKYKEHMLKKHNVSKVLKDNDIIHHCSQCSFKNSSMSRVKAHMTLKHDNAEKKFPCSVCKCSYSSRSGLSKHRRREHGVEDQITSNSSFSENIESIENAVSCPSAAESSMQSQVVNPIIYPYNSNQGHPQFVSRVTVSSCLPGQQLPMAQPEVPYQSVAPNVYEWNPYVRPYSNVSYERNLSFYEL